MESSVTPLPHRRSYLPSRTYRSLLHLCSSFDREPRVSLATPAVLQELVLRTEIAQVPPGETCEPREIIPSENPPENLSMLESTTDGASGESGADKVETISQEKSLMLVDIFDGIDLQDASFGNQQNDIFDDFERVINESEGFVPESCVDLFEALDVNDYDDVGMVASVNDIVEKPLDLAQNVAEKPNTATELREDTVEGDKKASDVIESKEEEVPKSVELNEVISSGVSENNNETVPREMELEKAVSNTQVLAASDSQMVEDDDVEEGEISGDDNVDMLIGDDLPEERHEESHVSQELSDKRGEGSSKSYGSNLFSGVGSLSTLEVFEEKEERKIGKNLGAEVSNVDNRAKKSDQVSNNEEKLDPGTSIKKRSAPSKEAKARKKAKSRKKRAQERIALGVKKLKLKTVAPKPKPIKYCRHYLKGRCHEGDKCKFSHDTTPETKSSPCCYFATQSCMKGDDCPYDHDLSKYPCTNFISKGFCHRGDNCLFSHKGTPQSASDKPSANVTTSSPQKSNKQTVRDAIAKLPAIQARVSGPVAFLKPPRRNSSSQKANEHVTPPQILPLRKPSVAPKGMSFLSLDKTSQKQNTQDSDNQSMKQSQQKSFLPLVPPKGISFLSFASEEHKTPNREPQEPSSSSTVLNTTPNSHIQSSLNSAMKLAAEFESAKVERRINDPAVATNKGDEVTVNTSVTKNSGNISSKILEFLSSFTHSKNCQ